MPASSYQQQKLRVCEVCSAYLGIHDNDRRLADHFGGKLHLGFIKIREKLEALMVRPFWGLFKARENRLNLSYDISQLLMTAVMKGEKLDWTARTSASRTTGEGQSLDTAFMAEAPTGIGSQKGSGTLIVDEGKL